MAFAAAEPSRPEDAVEVGRILGAWGVKGGLKVKPFSSDPQALFSSKRWFLEPSEAKPGHTVPALLRVRSARAQGDTVVAVCEHLDDRDAPRSWPVRASSSPAPASPRPPRASSTGSTSSAWRCATAPGWTWARSRT